MKRLSFVFATATLALVLWIPLGRAQGQSGNPHWDRSDKGEVIHVLPPKAALHSPHDTQPTDAPPSSATAVYPASYGRGNLFNHGGPQIADAGFWAVYWNAAAANSTDTSSPSFATMKDQIDAFITSFADGVNWNNSATADYTIIQQYGAANPIARSLRNWGFFVDAQPTQATIQDSAIRDYLTSLFTSGQVAALNSVVYGVYFPPEMQVKTQGGGSCTTFCGYHGNFNYNGMDIKYAAFPYLNCSACMLTGKHVADMLTIVTSHEIREAVTDPDLNAWYDSAGYEADDKCAWHNLYQMSNGGFWVQPEYSNGGTVNRSGFTATYPGPGCVVPNQSSGGGGGKGRGK
jgi:hypothetical protein